MAEVSVYARAAESVFSRIWRERPGPRIDRMGEALAHPPQVHRSFGPRLPRVGSVNAVGLEEHAAALARLAVEGDSRLQALELAVRVLEVTALERTVTPGAARDLCARAVRHGPAPPVAAVCVRPDLVPLCHDCLAGTGVLVAALVTPADVRRTMELGADELEIRIDGGAFLSGCYAQVAREIARVKDTAGGAALTVVIETEGLGTYDGVRRASLLAMVAGADFVETSPASLPVALCVLEAIRDVCTETGHVVGFKAFGGLGTAEQAIHQLVLVHETLGPGWLTPDLCRLGASSLLDDLLLELRTQHADDAYDLRRH
jgi:deoxyribose-phosphate aldolase